jgi:hypothetical protein
MRAVNGSLGHSLQCCEKRDGGKRKRPGDSLCSRNAWSRTPLVERAHGGKPPGRPLPILEEEDERSIWRTVSPRRGPDDENVECPCFFVFYDALETNDSAVKVFGEPTLTKIARELAEMVKKNVPIDWTARENVRAQLRVLVTRILRKYGYPPGKQEQATKVVLE